MHNAQVAITSALDGAVTKDPKTQELISYILGSAVPILGALRSPLLEEELEDVCQTIIRDAWQCSGQCCHRHHMVPGSCESSKLVAMNEGSLRERREENRNCLAQAEFEHFWSSKMNPKNSPKRSV